MPEIKKPSNYSSQTKPASLSPQLGQSDAAQFEHHRQQNSKVLWGIFSLLFVLVVLVIFVLPTYISPTDTKPPSSNSSNPNVAEVTPSPEATSLLQISPFEEAQVLRQRQEAQASLANLLNLQQALEEKNVTAWAQDEFSQAIALAISGDEAYSLQTFDQAQVFYQQGADMLLSLEQSLPTVFTLQIGNGEAAILDGNPDLALQAYGLAQLLEPDNALAINGLERAENLQEVLELIVTGNNSIQLETARDAFQQALAIDPEHIEAATLLRQTQVNIIDRDYSQLMSSGYGAIQNNMPEQAELSFSQALTLKPSSDETLTAISQAQDQIASSAINNHVQNAQNFERAEQWSEALAAYNQALIIDANINIAVQGKNRSESRNNLHLFLEDIIDSPLRLAETGVYEQTIQVHADATTLSTPGSLLERQLSQIQVLLSKATQAVNVSFRSDGLTEVTLMRISVLGQFQDQSLSLVPGEYTIVGIRDGYRDVRQAFIIPIDGPIPVVSIYCDEAI